jgi:methylamine dehydrogenase accessory protein MauD
MAMLCLLADVVLLLVILGLSFLHLGTLRALGQVSRHQDELESGLHARPGQHALAPGRKAPHFTLRSGAGGKVGLRNFAARKVLLVFADGDDAACQRLLPELLKVQRGGSLQVVVVSEGDPTAAARWVAGARRSFPVLVAGDSDLSRRYRVPAMPYAFLIDGQRVIVARGIIHSPQHVHFLLAAARAPSPPTPLPLGTGGEGGKSVPDGATPAGVDRLHARLGDFIPRPDDIFIVTYPRSGTTWMQMILYQLTSGGDMDFAHIEQVCPWWEHSLHQQRLNTLASPRVFKSHLSHGKMPRLPGKYIYVARIGKDVAVSYYHFYTSHMGYRGTFADFFERFLAGRVQSGSWFNHVRGWWEHRADPNMLFLRYEDLLADLPGCLRKISGFCGLEVPAERLPGILERCSFTFMKQHECRFDPLLAGPYELGIRPHAFLRQGQAGAWREQFSPAQAQRFDRVLHRRLGQSGIDLYPAPSPLSTGGPIPCRVSMPACAAEQDGRSP